LPIYVIKSRRGKLKKIDAFRRIFSQNVCPPWPETVPAPVIVLHIIYQYTASTAHLTNHDTRDARHKEPGEISLSASCLLRHTRCSVSFLVTQYPVKFPIGLIVIRHNR